MPDMDVRTVSQCGSTVSVNICTYICVHVCMCNVYTHTCTHVCSVLLAGDTGG